VSSIADRMHPYVRSTLSRASPPLTGRDAQHQVMWHRASDQPCLSFSHRGQIPNASGLNFGRVWSRKKNHRRVKCRTCPVPMSDESGLPETSTFNTFLNTLLLCANTKVSHHLCTCVSIFHKHFQGLSVRTLDFNAYAWNSIT
jgi:hypothetical protein